MKCVGDPVRLAGLNPADEICHISSNLVHFVQWQKRKRKDVEYTPLCVSSRNGMAQAHVA